MVRITRGGLYYLEKDTTEPRISLSKAKPSIKLTMGELVLIQPGLGEGFAASTQDPKFIPTPGLGEGVKNLGPTTRGGSEGSMHLVQAWRGDWVNEYPGPEWAAGRVNGLVERLGVMATIAHGAEVRFSHDPDLGQHTPDFIPGTQPYLPA